MTNKFQTPKQQDITHDADRPAEERVSKRNRRRVKSISHRATNDACECARTKRAPRDTKFETPKQQDISQDADDMTHIDPPKKGCPSEKAPRDKQYPNAQ